MSYDRSTTSLNASSPQSAIYCFLFQFTVSSLSLKSSSSCLYLLLRLTLTSTLHSIFLSITCLEGSFYSQRDQSKLPSMFFLFLGYSSSPRLFALLLNFSHDFTSFSSTTFQNFPGISVLLSEMSIFYHLIKLCSTCSTY
jgi:hypothetical protein